MKPSLKRNEIEPNCTLGIFASIFGASSFLYFIYFYLSTWIWSQNIRLDQNEITPWIKEAIEQDGIEIYALYSFVFCNIIAGLVLQRIIRKCKSKTLLNLGTILAIGLSIIYFATIKFIPPYNSLKSENFPSELINITFLLIALLSYFLLLSYFIEKSNKAACFIIALTLLPICLIETGGMSWYNYSYVFSPALRFLQGNEIREIYFQYDLLPSLLAAAWMNLNLDLNYFQIIGRISYCIAIFSIFLLALQIFSQKKLAILLVITLVLVRIYASPFDPALAFQVTPIRLDLWILLALTVYHNGLRHWSTGISCGLLIIFSKNFGIIYAVAYAQLLATVFCLNFANDKKSASSTRFAFQYIKEIFPNLALIAFSFIINFWLTYNTERSDYTSYYQKLGIGFTPISRTSFYWYFFLLFSIAISLLLILRKTISKSHFETGLLLTYCAIGNSVYFFGRSHEHNLINISLPLTFLLFFCIDLLGRLFQEKSNNKITFYTKKQIQYASLLAGISILVTVVFFYSENIQRKIISQTTKISTMNFEYENSIDTPAFQEEMRSIKKATSNDKLVYFIATDDFKYYFYGNYKLVGFFNPFTTWIFSRDLNKFSQNLLDNDYYLVVENSKLDSVKDLNFSHTENLGKFSILKK